MKKRLLGQHTIVPESLYVERRADRELEAILDEMGRPAYILVARQMGKTNLLLHAKRRLETESDIFVYIDLSNRFQTDRECFRNIIDKIVQIYGAKLNVVEQEILVQRNQQKAVHIEHSWELRRILKAITGKLIIILDEVDSLTGADYSDKFFAHIRSIYFERVNYIEYERLGYVLSGVAEPSQIIKDKSISPFNIGQKVILGDFTFSEFKQLLKKSSLRLSTAVSERVFHWANGSPRLSWELCSEIELLCDEPKEISVDDVDTLVKELYLSRFDKPPVDHIRELVRSDASIRRAVMAILYGRSHTIPDEILTKLYLSGILSSGFEYGDIVIKNRVVEASLSEQWISQIDTQEEESFSRAKSFFTKKEYSLAIDAFSSLIESSEPQCQEWKTINDHISACYYYLGEYGHCIEQLKDGLFDKTGFLEMYQEQIYRLAMAHSRINEYEKSLFYFEEIISCEDSKRVYDSLLNKASVLLDVDRKKHFDEAVDINRRVIAAADQGEVVSGDTLAVAFYNLAVLLEKKDDHKSYEYYLKAAEYGAADYSIGPLISALVIRPAELDHLTKQIISKLSGSDIRVELSEYASPLSFSVAKFDMLVDLLFEKGLRERVDEIIFSVEESCFEKSEERIKFYIYLGEEALQNSNMEKSLFYFGRAAKTESNNDTAKGIFLANKMLTAIDPSNNDALQKYLKGVQNYCESSDVIDVSIFNKLVTRHMKRGEKERAKRYCDIIISLEGTVSASARLRLVPIYERLMFLENDPAKKVENAEAIIAAIESHESNISLDGIQYFDKKSFLKAARTIKARHSKIETVVHVERKIGRNQRVKIKYEDGRLETKKYKLVQESVDQGLCEVVSVEDGDGDREKD